MFERYTEKARRVIFFARYEASQFGSSEITTEHLLLALFRESSAFLKSSVPKLAADRARQEIEKHTSRGEHIPTSVNLPLSQSAKRALAYAAEEAARLNHDHIGGEHLLLGLAREKDCLAAKLLREHGFDPVKSRNEIARIKFAKIGGETWASFVTCAEAEAWGVLYHWEKRRCEPRDALRNRVNQRVARYDGGPYDGESFDLVKASWTDYRCAICWAELYFDDSPDRSVGYTNGQDWICATCYERFAAPASEERDDE